MLRRDTIQYRGIAKSAAPFEQMRNTGAILGDLGGNLRQIAVAQEPERFADVNLGVAVLVIDSQSIGCGGRLVQGVIDVYRRLAVLIGDRERRRNLDRKSTRLNSSH